jgi:hypothetical protein
MPKKEIDYSNTIIYKIFCKNPNINDVYVGHTTNFIQRKYSHKLACNSKTNNLKMYNIIRENGGWDNWDMIEIAKYNCKNHTEARIKENEHYEQLNCSLNSKPPYANNNRYYCKVCETKCYSESEYNNHFTSKKHKMSCILLENEDDEKKSGNYLCKKCNYYTTRHSQYLRHLKTNKHKEITPYCNKDDTKDSSGFSCICGNIYSYKPGLYKHKKKCTYTNAKKNDIQTKLSNEQLIMTILKDNEDFKQIIIKQNATIIEQNEKMIELNSKIVELTSNDVH